MRSNSYEHLLDLIYNSTLKNLLQIGHDDFNTFLIDLVSCVEVSINLNQLHAHR